MGDKVPAKVVGRFAPSPTGRMHAGNIFASLMSWLIVKSLDGHMVLRIEDLDEQRSKRSWADQIMRDYEFLGLTWDDGPYYQQAHKEAYREAFEALSQKGMVYPCFCTRADLHSASAPHRGEKLVYPGTCRNLTEGQMSEMSALRKPAYRLFANDVDLEVNDLIQGAYQQNLARECGDFVIRRSDGLFAYQLAVVVDDAHEGVNLVVRGMDLLVSTPQQIYLQQLLGFEGASYAHVPLLVSSADRRLSKRDRDAGLDELLKTFKTPEAILGHIAHVVGIVDKDEPLSSSDLLESFKVENLDRLFSDKVQIIWQ